MKKYRFLLPLILLAYFLRVWQLPHIPPGLWYDEAYYSMDAAWLLDGGPWRIFFVGNNGREPIFIYLQTLFIWIFGASPLTSRLVAPLIGTLTVPAIYVLARRLVRGTSWSRWVPYLATAGMAVSFWHVGLSRGGYRGILLPLVLVLTCYAFWRGWRENSPKFMVLAGVALGVSQYTYLSARVLPLAFGLLALIWMALNWRNKSRLKTLWMTLLLMAIISAAIFAPLGWIFYQEPDLFSARTGDVLFTPDSPGQLASHLSDAIRLFFDGGDPNWRHHLPGRPMLGWLGWLGFWPGLIVCLRRVRRPQYLFLMVMLLTLDLPALISVPPAHALRLAALLPVYYVIFALGLTELVWVFNLLRDKFDFSRTSQFGSSPPFVAAFLLAVLLLETGLTTFDYFYRWAPREEIYVEYNGPLVDFVNHVIDLTDDTAVIIPFQLYVHPTTRYLLHDQFVERRAPATLRGPVRLVTLPDNFRMLNVANISPLPSFVWLAREASGQGVAYVSRPPRQTEQAYLSGPVPGTAAEVYHDRFGRDLAQIRLLDDPSPLLPMFTELSPLRAINLNWANLAELMGYEVTPELVQPGQPVTLNLYWRSLTEKTFDYRLFLQLVDSGGQPINQWEGEAFREDMYRWRPDGILPTQHTLWLGPETPPGPYLIRIGFFDSASGERLPLHLENAATPIDQIQLGLFYVSDDGSDPRQPTRHLSANFANAIELKGVTFTEIQDAKLKPQTSKLKTTFYWQTLQPTDQPLTIFLQLLNEQDQVVSSWDSQPFNGLYPTNLWSPGETIVDTFELPLPEAGLSPGTYRLITGFYDFETGRRFPVVGGGDFAELGEFVVN